MAQVKFTPNLKRFFPSSLSVARTTREIAAVKRGVRAA